MDYAEQPVAVMFGLVMLIQLVHKEK